MGLFRRSKPKPAATATPQAVPLPRDPRTGDSLEPREQPGYYPGYSTVGQKKFWEKATRDVVVDRVNAQPLRRFFTEDEWNFWEVVFEHLLPQSDRTADRRIPLIPPLDERLFKNQTDGYRYEDMPTDQEVYKLGIAAINEEAQERFDAGFLALPYEQREQVIEAIQQGKPEGAPRIWHQMSAKHFWELILSDAIKAYYAHPWSWDEIGFGGPAYPRAYTRLERGEPEPWEVEEKRYAWAPPGGSRSGKTESDVEQRKPEQTAGSGGRDRK